MSATELKKLQKKRLYWCSKRSRLPQDLINHYTIDLYLDEFDINGQIKEKMYLICRHKINKQQLKIVIDDHNEPKSCMNYAQIISLKQGGYQAILKQPVDQILFTTIQNYNKILPCIRQIEMKEKKPFQSDSQVQDYLDHELANSQLDSDEAQQSSIISKLNNEQQDQSDPSIKIEILYILKKDRFKKLKEIKSMLQQKGFNVAQTKLKQMLNYICGTYLYDRKKGYLIKAQLLSNQEREKRDQDIQQQQKKILEKPEKQVNRKQAKKNRSNILQENGELKSLFSGSQKPIKFIRK